MKKLLLISFAILSLTSKQTTAQDDCTTAQAIGSLPTAPACPGTGLGAALNIPGTLVGATAANPYLYQPGCTGGAMAVPANDVWYSFVATGYQAVITINSTFSTPNIAMYSGVCGALGGGVGGCAVGAGGTVTLTVEQMVPGTTYYLQVSGGIAETGTFNMIIKNNRDCADCMNVSTFTATPLPVNGMYTPGQVVSFCYHVGQYTQISTNWLHGVQLAFGAGWNVGSLTTTSPVACQGTGTWAYYPGGCTSTATSVFFGPGFYFDNDADGIPGNNYGDNCSGTQPAGTWNFCFTIAVAAGCSPGSNLSVAVNTSGDGESGSWSSLGCVDDPASNISAVGACCAPAMAQVPATCVGNDGTATATPVGVSGPYDYSWTNSGGTVISTTNGVAGSNTITGLVPGTYTVGITNIYNCLATNTVVVTSGAGAVGVPTAASNSPVCENATLNLTAATIAGPTTYSWTGPNGFISNTQNPNIANVTSAENGTYTVTATQAGCSNTSSVTVTVNPIPTVNDPIDQLLCANVGTTAVNFTGTPVGTTFNWTNTNATTGLAAAGTGNIASFTATNAGAVQIISTITVTPTMSGCTGTPQTFTITVDPIPTVADPADQVLCTNTGTTAIIFTGNNVGTTYTWTNTDASIGLAASGTGNIASFTAINASASPVVASITVTPTMNGCTGIPQLFTITVNPIPTITDPVDQVLCANTGTTAINFTGNVVGTTYNWTNTNATIGMAAAGSGNITSFTATNAGAAVVVATITVTPTISGCTGTPQLFTITVDPIPTVTDPADQVLCANTGTIAVNFTGNMIGTTYSWTNTDPTIGLAAAGTGNIASFSATNAGAAAAVATITVTPTMSGCIGTPQTFTITVNPIPTVTDPADQVLCANTGTTAVNFTGTPVGATYNWTNTDLTIGLAATGSGNIASFNTLNAGATPVVASITVTPSMSGCTGVPQTFTITVNPSPTVTDPIDQVLCANTGTTAVSFSGNVAGATYNWTNTDATIGLPAAGTGNIPSFTGTNAGATAVVATITVSPTMSGCAGLPQSFTITVNPIPTVTDPADQVLCANTGTTAVIFTGNSVGATYNWTNTDATIGLAASGSGNIASFNALNAGATPVVASITVTPTMNGCVGLTQTFIITVNPIPTVLDPVDEVLCANTGTTPVNFTGNVSGATYNWTNTDATIGLAATGSGTIASFTAINSGASPVVATIAVTPTMSGCIGTPQTFTITVNPIPILTDPVDEVLCANTGTTAVNFTGNVVGASYNWTNTDATIGLAATGTGNIASFTAINTSAAPVIANITVTPTMSGCTGLPQTFTITVNPIPTVIDPVDEVLCANTGTTAVNFTGNVLGATYNWTNTDATIGLATNGSGTIASFTAINSGASPVVAAITVIPTMSGCIGLPQTFTITVNPIPTVIDPVDEVLCANTGTTAINFTGNITGATYNWTNTDASIGLATNGSGDIASFTATNASAVPVIASITVTPTMSGCFGTPQTFTLTVNPIPTVTDPADQVLCANTGTTPINFTGNILGATYNWTNTDATIGLAATGSGAIASFTATNAGAAPVIASITVSPTMSGCIGTLQTFTITVNPIPTVTDPADQVLCANTGTTLINFTGNIAGTTYSWTNTDATIGLAATGTGTIASFTATNTGAVPLVATITVTPSMNGCTGISQTFTITVNPIPTVVDPASQVLCANTGTTAINFSGNVVGTTYNWVNTTPVIGLGASGTGNIATFTATNTTAASITGTITVTPTANTCVGSPSIFTILVYPIPTVGVPTVSSVCNGSSVSVASFTSPTIGTTYSWTNTNAAIGLGVGGTGNIPSFTGTNNTTAPITGTVTVTPTANDCPGVQSTFTITINPTPESIAGPDKIICSGGSVSIGTINNPAYSYSWIFSPSLSGTSVSNPTVLFANSGPLVSVDSTYYVTTTEIATNCFSKDTVIVTVNEIATANAGSKDTVCGGKTIHLAGAVGGSVTSGTWSGGTGVFSPSNVYTQGGPDIIYSPGIADTLAGSVTLTLTTIDPDGATGPCSSSYSSQTFYFWKNPIIQFTAGPDACPPHDVPFVNQSTVLTTALGPDPIVSYLWDFGDFPSATSTALNPTHNYLTSGFYTVTLTAWTLHGCTTTESVVQMVQVFPKPEAIFNSVPTTASTLNSEVTLYDQSKPPVPAVINYWHWNFGDGDSLVSTTTPNPVHEYPNEYAGSYLATLIVQNTPYLCRDTTTREIFIGPEFTFFIPNAFSPNNDGINDTFFGSGIGIKDYEIYIYDRWGNLIYYTDILGKAWDGKANHGREMAQQDVYVWKVKLNDVFGKKHNYIGTVTIVK